MTAGLGPGFTGNPLDRADRLRQDPAALAAAGGDWRARLLRLDGLTPAIDDTGALDWTSLADRPDDAELILLGLDGDRPRFVALRPASGEATTPAMRDPALMTVLGRLPPGEAALYATARALIDWHNRHRFCARSGHPTRLIKGGWARHCDGCGAEHFPRVDPVVIMIAEHAGRALLGRGRGWPEGRYSALAGFVEPGESVEEAVAREVHEEAGVLVEHVRYVASQPWPFPSQLMLACVAEAVDDALNVDKNELADARWFTRDQVRAALAGDGPFGAPPPYAIAHTLLTQWVAGQSRPSACG